MAAVGHAGPMDVEAWREELRSVLESRSFRQAPTLSHLLRYLCEKLFAGESSQIKEYSIGVEMFRRGDSFDQETDSIVRVEVNRLRKRLADYYAGEGASHKLQIVIPVGQYVPSFVSTVREPEAQPAEAPTEIAAPAWWRRRWIWVAGAAGVVLVAGTVWLAAHRRQPPPQDGVSASVDFESPCQKQNGQRNRVQASEAVLAADRSDKNWLWVCTRFDHFDS